MSGLRVLEALPETEAETALRAVAEAAGCSVIVHCCAAAPPISLLHGAGVAGVSLDCRLLSQDDDKTEQAVGEAVEAGLVLFAGLAASSGQQLSDPAGTVDPLRNLWRRLGLDPSLLATSVVVTPTCGLAGASPGQARAALERCRQAAQLLVDDPEG
jgi:methionine synthase II (cobalamin-independent)